MLKARGIESRFAWTIAAAVAVAGFDVSCSSIESGNDRFGAAGLSRGVTQSEATSSGGENGLAWTSQAMSGNGGVPGSDLTPRTAGGATNSGPDPSTAAGSYPAEQDTAGAGPIAKGGTATSGGAAGAAPAGASAGASTCWDSEQRSPACFRCSPSNIVEFERACTSSACVPFDNEKRLPKLDVGGRLPDLPVEAASSGGATSSPLGGKAGVGGDGSAGAGLAGAASSASGAGCDALATRGKVVYVTGSSAAKPFLQQIAQQVALQSIFVVYISTGSCVGVDAALHRTLIRTGPAPLPATTATYWDSASSSGKSCQLPTAGVVTDIGISDVFAQTCPGSEMASLTALQVQDAHGPIQTMAFVVPATSHHSQISAQAAYLVFGLGASGAVLDESANLPIWNNEDSLFVRTPSSGTQAMLAAAIGVPSSKWRGKTHASSDDIAASLQSALSNQSSSDQAIGILAADYIDSRNLRAQLRMLAFQDTNQTCAYYPDSTAMSRDKRNVRDGHYAIWSPLHLLYRVDDLGRPENPTNRQELLDILGYLSGSKALPNGVRLMDIFAQSGLVPECAMHVSRLKDGGNLLPFVPSSPCSCSFDQATTGETACRTCKVQGDCKDNEVCSLGFCES